MTTRIAVLASGRGSNLLAILQVIDAGQLDAEVVGVFSDKPGAPALQRVPPAARWSRDAKAFADREAFDAELADAVAASQPDWIVCAGYMRILGEAFVQRFRGRLLNIHPSLLPKYRGLRTHARALQAGDVEHGASVHFVVPELDAKAPRQAGEPGIGFAGRAELDLVGSELFAGEVGDDGAAERLGDELVSPTGTEERLARGDHLLHQRRERRGEGLGPAQCLHAFAAGKRGAACRFRHRDAVRTLAAAGAAGAAVRLGR